MRLKAYQDDALAAIDGFTGRLARARADHAGTVKALSAIAEPMRGDLVGKLDDPAALAWRKAQEDGIAASTADWRSLKDGWGGEVPHVCLKMPTGSGKTLVAGHAVGRILAGLDGARTGFVLWVVPSDAIFQQTWAQLRDRGHPIRQALDRASGGSVKLIGKTEDFTRLDVSAGLTVMLLMLQSAAGRRDDLKFLRDSGAYGSFYPAADDLPALAKLRAAVPNLSVIDFGDATSAAGYGVKQSLENTLKIVRPLIVLDEGHTAYSPDRRALLGSLNPRFLLELTATPSAEHSNILYRVGGETLRDTQMIKLPIRIGADAGGRWQDTLKAAIDRRGELERAALLYHGQAGGRFIRPILIVRVERVGVEQRVPGKVHTLDVREELGRIGINPDWVREQTSVRKELDDTLMDDTSPVRVIITKDALREGWDCPFAYVLALLSATKARTTLTQMIGRVLRQPFARATGIPALDSAHVFSASLSVNDAVAAIKAGLEGEGLEDVGGAIRRPEQKEAVTVARRAAFSRDTILAPSVTHDDGRGGRRSLDFDRDILSGIDWRAIGFPEAATITLSGDGATRAFATIDYASGDLAALELVERELGNRIDRPDLARRLTDLLLNPWVAMRIIDETLDTLRGRGMSEEDLARFRLPLIGAMRESIGTQIDTAARGVFERKLVDGAIALKLTGGHDLPFPETWAFDMGADDRYLRRDGDVDLQRTLFERIRNDLNGFEQGMALYLDSDNAVAWWWRLAVKGDWGLQGWRRRRVYPDFLVRLTGDGLRLLALETKGKQFEGSDDTGFKRDLFSVLERSYAKPGVGELIYGESPDEMRFRMVLQNEAWATETAAALGERS